MNFVDSIFKNWFGGFLSRRRVTQLFGRGALLDTVGRRGAAEAIPEHVSRDMLKAATDDLPGSLIRLASHEDGLSAPEAAERLTRFGLNEVEHEKPLPWWLHLWHCYKNPFNLLLTVLAGVSFLTDDLKATIVIGTIGGAQHVDPLRTGGQVESCSRAVEGDGHQHGHGDPSRSGDRSRRGSG